LGEIIKSYFHAEKKIVQQKILQQYGFDDNATVTPLGNGLINTTWLVTAATGDKFVLQRINHKIFKDPAAIAFNIRSIGAYLVQQHPGYLFTHPVITSTGDDMVVADGEWYRMFQFIEGSHTIDVVASPEQAYEAARQFGKFTKLLADFDAATLKTTLPDFHHLPMRYRQFESALKNASSLRMQSSVKETTLLLEYKNIVKQYADLLPHLKIRVTHHDTKISNVLFDEQGKGLCVIDLDTVMPGYFISDVGDMMRTYLCPVSEEEKDCERIVVRKEFYTALKEGYLAEMKDELSAIEKEHFLFAGKMMVYMQALRFLTDYLNNDIYYGSRYKGHNLVRAGNQLALLQQLLLLEEGV
jgi:Ser/Thr protein kinase RdoA (MazF antagonist)